VSWASLSLAPAPDIPGNVDDEPAWNAQLMVGGKSLGRFWLGSRRAGPSFDADEQAGLNSLVGQAALALAYADTIEALSQLNRELESRVEQRTTQVLDGQRALAAFEERQRLARDLHDSVTQSLFSINLSARALRNLVHRNPESVIAGLNELEETAQQALREMRTLLAQLRSASPPAASEFAGTGAPPIPPSPPVWEDLVPTLVAYCEGLRQLDVRLDHPPTLLLPASVAHQVMQIVREALHNVVKHSGVPRALCRALLDDNWLKLTIADDGQGFDPENASSAGFGIRGMQERARSIGGRLEIHSSPSSGATLTLTIPLQPSPPPPSP